MPLGISRVEDAAWRGSTRGISGRASRAGPLDQRALRGVRRGPRVLAEDLAHLPRRVGRVAAAVVVEQRADVLREVRQAGHAPGQLLHLVLAVHPAEALGDALA